MRFYVKWLRHVVCQLFTMALVAKTSNKFPFLCLPLGYHKFSERSCTLQFCQLKSTVIVSSISVLVWKGKGNVSINLNLLEAYFPGHGLPSVPLSSLDKIGKLVGAGVKEMLFLKVVWLSDFVKSLCLGECAKCTSLCLFFPSPCPCKTQEGIFLCSLL